MAVVYAAYDLAAGRPARRAQDAARARRRLDVGFSEREAEILAAVRRPGDRGLSRARAARGRSRLARPRVADGRDAAAGACCAVRSPRRGAGPRHPRAGLARWQLHDRGVVHRDIKPENLFLCGGPDPADVCLLDLGIARLLAPDRRTTRHGMVVGTPAYMAPEQARAAPELDHRADLYALGDGALRVPLRSAGLARTERPGRDGQAARRSRRPALADAAPILPPARRAGLRSHVHATRRSGRRRAERCAGAGRPRDRGRSRRCCRAGRTGASTSAQSAAGLGRRAAHPHGSGSRGAAHLHVPARRWCATRRGMRPQASEAERWQAHVEALLSENDARSADPGGRLAARGLRRQGHAHGPGRRGPRGVPSRSPPIGPAPPWSWPRARSASPRTPRTPRPWARSSTGRSRPCARRPRVGCGSMRRPRASSTPASCLPSRCG
jgi:serine/threonine protein kinase